MILLLLDCLHPVHPCPFWRDEGVLVKLLRMGLDRELSELFAHRPRVLRYWFEYGFGFRNWKSEKGTAGMPDNGFVLN